MRGSLSESQKLPVSSQREDEKAFQTVIKANTKALRQACHSQKDSVRRIAGEHWVRVEGGQGQARQRQITQGLLNCGEVREF